jgi:hypothetical protein
MTAMPARCTLDLLTLIATRHCSSSNDLLFVGGFFRLQVLACAFEEAVEVLR